MLPTTVRKYVSWAGAILCCGFWSLPVAAQESLVLQLRWDNEFQFAGYYAALWQGYYADAGLDVEIRSRIAPDGSFLDIFDEVSSGRADISIAGADILIQNDQGEDFVVLATILQDSPNAFYALSEETLSGATDFLTHRVALLEDDFTTLELFALLVAEGMEPAAVDRVPFQPGLEPLLRGDFEIAPSYRMSAEWRAQELGIDLARLTASSYGIEFYGDTLFTRRSFIEERSDTAVRFVRATVRGWLYALENHEEIAHRITDDLPRVIPYDNLLGYNLYAAGIIRELSGHPQIALGHTSPARWHRIHSLLQQAGFVSGPFDADALVFDPERWRQEQIRIWRMFAAVAAAVVVVLVLVSFAGFRFLRREVARATHDLAAERNRLRLVLDTVPVGVVWKDVNHVFQGANRAAQEIAGINRKFTGHRVDELFPPSLADAFRTSDATVMRTGRPEIDTIFSYERPGGGTRTLKRRKVPFLSESGQSIGVLSCIEDVTDLWDANRRLGENFNLLRVVFDTIPDPVFAKDLDGRFVIANERTAMTLGHAASELAGHRLQDVIEPNQAASMASSDQSVLETGETKTVDQTVCVNGDNRVFQTVKAAYRGADGRIVGLVGIARDITERQEAAQKLRESEMRYRTLFEQSHDPVVVIDPETTLPIQFSDRLCSFLGYSAEEMADIPVSAYEASESPEEIAKHVEKIIRDGADEFETKMRRKDGTIRDVLVIVRRITFGNRMVFHNMFRDITEQRQAELALKTLNQQLESPRLGDGGQEPGKGSPAHPAIETGGHG